MLIKLKLPLKLKIQLIQTIQRFSGPNIGFTLGSFMELNSLNVFKVFKLLYFKLFDSIINFN